MRTTARCAGRRRAAAGDATPATDLSAVSDLPHHPRATVRLGTAIHGFLVLAFRLVVIRPLSLVRNSTVLRDHPRKERLAEEKLLRKLREKGVADIDEVITAYMEGNGHTNVLIKREG